MRERVFRISPDGKTVQTITNGDDLPMGASAEDVQIVRASHVRFDNATKKWHVYFRAPLGAFGGLREVKSFVGFSTRKEAIEHEVRKCNQLLELFPNEVDELIKKHLEKSANSG
jgi:hypothetical protein